MKITGIILAILVTLGAGGYFFLLRAPAATDVCAHLKSLGSDEDVATCAKDMERRKDSIGAIKYAKQAKCIMAASTLDALGNCK